jgi:hypothetical protein
MKQRIFDIRLHSTYEGSDNKIATLQVEIEQEGQWHTLDIDTLSPGFLLLNYGLCSCQHLYFRTNAAECNLVLLSSTGQIHTVADENWRIQQIDIQFDGILKSGMAEQSNIDYIIDRMGHCPVSANLIEPANRSTRVAFHEH